MISLEQGLNDTIEEYGVTWAVQYWHANNEQNGPQNTGYNKPKNSQRSIIS